MRVADRRIFSTGAKIPTVYNEILYEVNDPVAIIRFNRPQAMNAWTDSMGREFEDAVKRASADPAVVGIIITGAGRAFCAGADMNVLNSLSSADPSASGRAASGESAAPKAKPAEDSTDDFAGRFPFLMRVPKPIIAAINGAVAGMAYPLTLCCDMRFMAPEAVMVTSFSQRGLIAEWGLSWLLPRTVGPAVALDLLYSARKVKAEEALRIGLINGVVPAEDLVEHCSEYIRNLAANCSPASMAVMKQQVYQQLHAGLGGAERDSIRLMQESFARPDFKEGVQSFMQKRPPQFARIAAE